MFPKKSTNHPNFLHSSKKQVFSGGTGSFTETCDSKTANVLRTNSFKFIICLIVCKGLKVISEPESKTKECANFKFEVKSSVK